MPLEHGKSKAAFSHNVEVEVNAGKPQKQAVAIAYREQRGADDIDVELRPAALRQHIRAHQALLDLASEALENETPGEDCEVEMDAADEAPRGMAFDRATTSRVKDINGWLHVRDCRISKANICPYIGHEIPGAAQLGLEPDRIYKLYRDAAALAASAPTFERAPLMLDHLPVTAETAQENRIKRKIIGAISNVRWQAPYLVADLTVWDGEGIEAIESERQQELSPGYHYRPEMNSGTLDGEGYDGRMLDIVANHLCIVDTGRTGPDVIVNDSLPKAA